MKKWIKVSLLKPEFNNLKNFAAEQITTASKVVNSLILNIDKAVPQVRELEAPNHTTAFHVEEPLVGLLTKKAKELKVSRNTLLRLLIADLKKVEPKEKEILDKEISVRISKEDKKEIKALAKKHGTSVGALVRKIFIIHEDFASYPTGDDFDDKISINVSNDFKEAFRSRAAAFGFSESDYLRNIICSLLMKPL